MTTACPTLVATNYPWNAQRDFGYCYDGTYWYGVNSSVAIRRRNFPAFDGDTAIYTGTNAQYPAIDFAGFLYCIDYRGSADVIVKVNLSDLSTTDLTSFTPPYDLYGLVYHPVTGLLYVIQSIGTGAALTETIFSINPTSGSTTAVYTGATPTAGDPATLQGSPTALTSDALWGIGFKRSGPRMIWRLSLPGHVFTYGVDSGGADTPDGPGVGTALNTLLISTSADYECDSSFALTSWSCTGVPVNVGIQHDNWGSVAFPFGLNVYEIETLPPSSPPTIYLGGVVIG